MSRLSSTAGSAPGVDRERTAASLGELSASFVSWMKQQDGNEDGWPGFDRWVRDTLHAYLGARRLRCFRVTEPDQQLVSLSSDLEDAFMARLKPHGLIDHVVSGGRRYVRGAPGNGELVERLARQWSDDAQIPPDGVGDGHPPDWLLPIRGRQGTIGLIVAGEVPTPSRNDIATLEALGHQLELFWRHMAMAQELAAARRTDQASGVLNRRDLTTLGERVLGDSAAEREPSVVIALAVEGVRRLDDQGQWELRDWLMQQIGRSLRLKLRSDDLVGRFSDDRFVGILRRLDLSLGQMVADKLLASVEMRLQDQPALCETVQIRCGMTEAGHEGLEPALVRAFAALERARIAQQTMVVVEQEASAVSNPVEVSP